MKMEKSIISTFVAVVIVLVIAVVDVKASSMYISCGHITQAKTYWCWAACAENVAKYGPGTAVLAKTQWDAVKYIKGSSTNEYPNVSGNVAETAQAVYYINRGYIYNYVTSTKTYTFLCSQISQDEPPILALYNNSTQLGHMVVMNGYYENGAYSSQVRFYNPSPSVNANIQKEYSALCSSGYNGMKYVETVWKGIN